MAVYVDTLTLEYISKFSGKHRTITTKVHIDEIRENERYNYTISGKENQGHIDFDFVIEAYSRSALGERDIVSTRISQFYTAPDNDGIGKACFRYMLKETVKFASDVGIDDVFIFGELSSVDKKYWPGSLIAYKKLADTFGLVFDIVSKEKQKFSTKEEIENLDGDIFPGGNFHYEGTRDNLCLKISNEE